MSFKYKTFGARFYGGQIDRIDQGLNLIGGISDENPDFIYCNDSSNYDEALKYKQEHPDSKLILNVLDVPSMYFGINFNPSELFNKLVQADAITSISQFVESQLIHYFYLESSVIYNPIKDINAEERKKGIKKYPFKAMMVGRVNDIYKRGNLSIAALRTAGFQENEVCIVGSEKPNWGTYLGVVDDEQLNSLYNSVDFVMMCSNFEGLGLPALEGMAAGAIPIICSDLPTASEFYPKSFWCAPNPAAIAFRMRVLLENPAALKAQKEGILKFSQNVIDALNKKKIAENILTVYKNIK